jgi:hypothetical protein
MLCASCTVTSGDDDSSQAGESSGGKGGSGGTGGTGSTTGGTGGTTGGAGGSSATGGTGGTVGGSAGTGGSTGGTDGTSGGTGGSTGGTGGSTGGTGGSMSGAGGSGGAAPTCDPIDGTTPYPDCAPSPDSADDACALCQQKSCCTELKNCRSYNPNNVCAYGGPSMDDPNLAPYAGAGEIGCIVTCLSEYVQTNEVCDTDGIDMCTSMCQTTMCGTVIGTSTNELFGCIQDHCAKDCFGADTCG